MSYSPVPPDPPAGPPPGDWPFRPAPPPPPEVPQQKVPSVWWTFGVTVLFPIIGAIVAGIHNRKAIRLGVQKRSYWTAFWVAFVISLILGGVVRTALTQGTGPSTGAPAPVQSAVATLPETGSSSTPELAPTATDPSLTAEERAFVNAARNDLTFDPSTGPWTDQDLADLGHTTCGYYLTAKAKAPKSSVDTAAKQLVADPNYNVDKDTATIIVEDAIGAKLCKTATG